jgi:hypothetical protein
MREVGLYPLRSRQNSEARFCGVVWGSFDACSEAFYGELRLSDVHQGQQIINPRMPSVTHVPHTAGIAAINGKTKHLVLMLSKLTFILSDTLNTVRI